MPDTTSPLARLVLVMVCLSVAGSLVAGTHYIAVDLPEQKTLQVPDNGAKPFLKCDICEANCAGKTDIYNCLTECQLIC